MKLSRDSMTRITQLPNMQLEQQSADVRQALVLRCQQLLQDLPKITEIEGIKRLNAAKWVIEQSVIKTLDRLGVPIDPAVAEQMLVSRFLTDDLYVAPASPKLAGTLPDGDFDF